MSEQPVVRILVNNGLLEAQIDSGSAQPLFRYLLATPASEEDQRSGSDGGPSVFHEWIQKWVPLHGVISIDDSVGNGLAQFGIRVGYFDRSKFSRDQHQNAIVIYVTHDKFEPEFTECLFIYTGEGSGEVNGVWEKLNIQTYKPFIIMHRSGFRSGRCC
jgi:hypothetical protein